MDLTIEFVESTPMVLEFPASLPGPKGESGSWENKVVSVGGTAGNTLTGNGSAKSFTVVHGSSIEYPPVFCFETSTGREYAIEATKASATQQTIRFAIAPTNGKTFKILIP